VSPKDRVMAAGTNFRGSFTALVTNGFVPAGAAGESLTLSHGQDRCG
jgi:hypothetical protein